jgi:hypothetical protein
MTEINRIFIVAFVLLALSSTVVAQAGVKSRGSRNYDTKTETTIKGTIDEVEQQAGRHGRMGTHLLLKTDSGPLTVHLGPSSYIAGKQFSFAKGDSVEVLGSKVTLAGKEVLLAREVTKQGKTLILRNAQGIPEWADGRRGQN